MKLPINYKETHYSIRRLAREEYARRQGQLCYHCGAPLNGHPPEKIRRLSVNEKLFPKGFFKWPIHLHHSHKTGLTIGAVHAYCNAVLWEYFGE